MKLSRHNRKLFEELKSLNLPSDQFVVFGSGPMGIRNLKNIGDVDIFVTPKLWRKLLRTRKSKDGEHIKLSEHVDAWRVWYHGRWDSKELTAEAEIIDGIKFVSLKRVLEWKKIRDKPKDQKDIAIIERYLASN